jgi:hypothetical protein
MPKEKVFYSYAANLTHNACDAKYLTSFLADGRWQLGKKQKRSDCSRNRSLPFITF